MPHIEGDIGTFIVVKTVRVYGLNVSEIPDPGWGRDGYREGQRGVSCGLYGLNYVMRYWYGWDHPPEEENPPQQQPPPPPHFVQHPPLPARVHEYERAPWYTRIGDSLAKKEARRQGQSLSLRQYAKDHHLTLVGSIFNAESLVKIARGASQQEFDGHVIDVPDQAAFQDRVERLLKLTPACPVLVPFDVNHDPESKAHGDPSTAGGTHAHWTVIIGVYEECGQKYAIHRQFGGFYVSRLAEFAASNAQLRAQSLKTLEKQNGDYRATGPAVPVTAERLSAARQNAAAANRGGIGSFLSSLFHKRTVVNYEFCDCQSPLIANLTADDLEKHGLPADPHQLAKAGLKGRIVAIYPSNLLIGLPNDPRRVK